jgi:hypothetical protein
MRIAQAQELRSVFFSVRKSITILQPKTPLTDSAKKRQSSLNVIQPGDPRQYLEMAEQVFKPHELARQAGIPYSVVIYGKNGELSLKTFGYGEETQNNWFKLIGIGARGFADQLFPQFQRPGAERSAVVVSPNSFGVSPETLKTNAFMSDLTPDKLINLINQSYILKEKLEEAFPQISNKTELIEKVLNDEASKKILSEKLIQAAVEEHKVAGEKLIAAGVKVDFFDSPPGCPDAVYPNNWAWTVVGRDGKKYLFISSMLNLSRQTERNQKILPFLYLRLPIIEQQ